MFNTTLDISDVLKKLDALGSDAELLEHDCAAGGYAMITIKVDAADLEAKMANLDRLQMQIDIGDAIAEEAVLPTFRKYPSPTGAKQPFKSDKSRRFFFAALKKGTIQVPYRRTQALAALWEVTQTGNTTTVRSTRKNAKLVIGMKDEQSKYHAGNWPSVEDVARDVEAQQAEPIGERVVQEHLKKAGLA